MYLGRSTIIIRIISSVLFSLLLIELSVQSTILFDLVLTGVREVLEDPSNVSEK